MNKALLWLFIGIGGTLGGLIPTWLGAGYFSIWGILGTALGSIAGIFAYNRLDL